MKCTKCNCELDEVDLQLLQQVKKYAQAPEKVPEYCFNCLDEMLGAEAEKNNATLH